VNAALSIALQTLRVLRRDKTAVFWMLLVPTVYIYVFGTAFRGGGDPASARAYLAVRNLDSGFLSASLIHYLQSENLQIDSLSVAPEGDPLRLLIIPQQFSDELQAGRRVKLLFRVKTGSDLGAEATAEMAVRKAVYKLLADLTVLELEQTGADEAAMREIAGRDPLIRVRVERAGRHKIVPSGFNHQVPANIVMFTMLIVFIYAGSLFTQERGSGVLRRIRAAPVRFIDLFLGKLLGVMLVGLIQVGLLMLVGRFVFGVYYGSAPAALGIMVFGFVLAVGSMGLCLGYLIGEEEKLIAVSIILAIVLSALSGCWWPLEVTPGWMRTLASLLPSGMAMMAFHRLISYGYGFEAVWGHVLGLAGYSLLFSLLFARFLQRRQP